MRLTSLACPVIAGLALSASGWGQAPAPVEPSWSLPRAIARRISAEYRALDEQRLGIEGEMAALPPSPRNERSARFGWKIFGYGNLTPARHWVEIDLGTSQTVDAIVLIPADPPANEGTDLGTGFPLRFRVDLEIPGGVRTPIANFTATDFPNPGPLPVFLPAHGLVAQRIRVTLTKPWSRRLYQAYAFGEIMVLNGNRNLATGLRGVTVRTSASHESPPGWSRENLIDGQSAVGAPMLKSDRPLATGWKSTDSATATTTSWVQVDLGSPQSFDEVRLTPARLPDYSESHGFGFPRRFRLEASNDPGFREARTLTDWNSRSLGDPLFSPITVPGDGLLHATCG